VPVFLYSPLSLGQRGVEESFLLAAWEHEHGNLMLLSEIISLSFLRKWRLLHIVRRKELARSLPPRR
jgi:hypothetical protein